MARNNLGNVVVRPRLSRPAQVLVIAAAGALLVLGGVALYLRGLAMAGFDRRAAIEQRQSDATRISGLIAENRTLRQSLAIAERSVQMDQTAYRSLNASLKRSAREIARLEEHVDLYREILAPRVPLQGVTIDRLNLTHSPDGHYRYTLILVQPLEARTVARGTLHFVITGTQAGAPVTLTVPGRVDKPITVNFKYFQDIEGVLDLPAGFSPESIAVDVRTQGRHIDKTFGWAVGG